MVRLISFAKMPRVSIMLMTSVVKSLWNAR